MSPVDTDYESSIGAVQIGDMLCDGRTLWYFLSEVVGLEKNAYQPSGWDMRFETSIVKLDLESGEILGEAPVTDYRGADILGVYRGKALSCGIPRDADGNYLQSDTGRQFDSTTPCSRPIWARGPSRRSTPPVST